jgi:hypothetical protein
MLRRMAIVGTDVSEELSASIISVTRIGELGTLAVTSNRRRVRIACLSLSSAHEDGSSMFLRNVGDETPLSLTVTFFFYCLWNEMNLKCN